MDIESRSTDARPDGATNKHIGWVFGLWMVLTAVGLWAATAFDLNPIRASREAEIVDNAFEFLLLLAVPVAAFVLALLFYSIYAFRSRNEPGDGAGFATNKRFVSSWVVVTASLAVLVIIHPGLTGLAELEAEPEFDLTVEVTAQQWSWTYAYVDSGITIEAANELVLPVDQRARFLITSVDVIHSFWIPGFRTKIDAVPGKVTEILATPTEEGTFTEDPNFRVQCAELCGTGHARMSTGVRVVSSAEFTDWLTEEGG